jgi:large subunit ribosomal protein L13
MDHLIDATDQRLGRLASRVAVLLQGKMSPSYNPRLASRDRVIVRNVSRIVVTGSKVTDKLYYRHTGYMGHLKSFTYSQLFERSPERLFRNVVYHMLPKNRLRRHRLRRLVIER